MLSPRLIGAAPLLASCALAASIVTLAAGCGGSSSHYIPPPADEDTSLGVGDVFKVQVIGEEELTGQHRISRDGAIMFPYVGLIQVAGLEPPQVAALLAQRLRDDGYLRDPQVTVFVEEANSKRVTINGAVTRPGTFPLTSGMTIVEAVSQAGGFTAMASRNNVTVTRRVEGRVRRFRVPVADIMSEGSDDFPLHAGDIIYVSERVL